MSVLIDTSVWINALGPRPPYSVERFAEVRDWATCLPIIQEVLQGFRDEFTFHRARRYMTAIRIVESPLGADVFDHAVDLYRTARKNGFTIRSSVDCLIAACAIRNGLEVLHDDRDYPSLAKVSALRERRVTP